MSGLPLAQRFPSSQLSSVRTLTHGTLPDKLRELARNSLLLFLGIQVFDEWVILLRPILFSGNSERTLRWAESAYFVLGGYPALQLQELQLCDRGEVL